MRNLLIGTMAVSLLLLVGGCSRDADDVTEDIIDTMNELTDVLSGIKTKEDAEAAKGEVKDLLTEMKNLAEEGEKMGKEMSDEDKKAVEERHKDDLEKAASAYMEAMGKVMANADVAQVLAPVFQEVGGHH